MAKRKPAAETAVPVTAATPAGPIRGIARGHKWEARQSPDGRYTMTFANGLEIAGIVADAAGLADKAERIAAERWEVKMEPATA